MITIYGTAEAAKRLGINPGRLKRWLDNGFYEPDYRAVLGDSEFRLFSESDIVILEQILGRIDSGMPPRHAFHEGDEE